jgi:hypothetical protein
MRSHRLATLIVIAGAYLGCSQAIMTAPAGSTIKLYANPKFIPAYGGVSVITAVVTEPAGTPVADGTVVQFFTDLGSIDEQGKTNDGVARVNLVSDSRSGTATVTAISGGAAAGTSSDTGSTSTGAVSDSTEIKIGNVLPTKIKVVAQPQRITEGRQSQIVATVWDENGNAVPRVDVIFTVTESDGTSPAAFERLASKGNPVFTDNSGRAYDTLRTNYDPSGVPRTVTVTATTANGVEDSTSVGIN